MNIPWLQKKVALDKAIAEALSQLDAYPAASPEYAKITKQIKLLTKMKTSKKNRHRVSPDTIVTVIGQLIAVSLIVNYEKDNALTTKAFTALPKLFRG